MIPDDKLSEILHITPQPNTFPTTVVEVVPIGSTADEDAELARTNIRLLLAQSAQALQELLQVANNSQHPRAYEVASQLLKTMADLNKDLLDTHKTQQTLSHKEDAKSGASIHVNNAVFVGTTKDLVAKIKDHEQ